MTQYLVHLEDNLYTHPKLDPEIQFRIFWSGGISVVHDKVVLTREILFKYCSPTIKNCHMQKCNSTCPRFTECCEKFLLGEIPLDWDLINRKKLSEDYRKYFANIYGHQISDIQI